MSQPEGFICVAWSWRRHGGYRLVHLHWPKSGITSCERAIRTRRAAEGNW